MIPDFVSIPLDIERRDQPPMKEEWNSSVNQLTGQNTDDNIWETPEGIPVQPIYTADDIDPVSYTHLTLPTKA